jgi:far upstream element-binding protein
MPSHKVGDETIYIQVPATRVGLVIGKGGETIKALQDRTGARINVTKDDEQGPNRTIVVAGSKQQLALAQAEIDDIVNGTGFAGAVILILNFR